MSETATTRLELDPAPRLEIDLDKIRFEASKLSAALPGVALHYAIKCNPHPDIAESLYQMGYGFEIASVAELQPLLERDIPLSNVLFSNPIRTEMQIRAAYEFGVRDFAFDSHQELSKLSACAPDADLYLRLGVPLLASDVPSEGKFGVNLDQAAELIGKALANNQKPTGLAFHVGSQMATPLPWVHAIKQAASLMRSTDAKHSHRFQTLNIGGGFPALYEGTPTMLIEIATAVKTAIRERLPYEVQVRSEPGRCLVANAGRMFATVIGAARRDSTNWLHLNVGAFHGLIEALETGCLLAFPMTLQERRSGQTALYNVTGPTCDSQDTIRHDVELPAGIVAGDTVIIDSAGAYTNAYLNAFNGFPHPLISTINN